MRIKTATRRYVGTLGMSFLKNGADDVDHRARNKARRDIGRALIEEALLDEETAAEVLARSFPL
jgi:hypothetical protein